jgi:hypothetical protein
MPLEPFIDKQTCLMEQNIITVNKHIRGKLT